MRTSKMAGLAPFRCGRTFVFRSGAAVAVLSACTTISTNVPPVAFPEGKYIYTEAPLTASLDPAAGWTFEFRGGGYVFYRDQVRVFEGSYAAARDTIAFRSEEGLPWTACRDTDAGPGVYQWRQDGDRLILVALHDSCERRLRQLTRSALVAGQSDPPQRVAVPDEIKAPWTAWFESSTAGGDQRVATLAQIITDDAQFMGVRGKSDILAFAADFFCATNGRKPGSRNYQLFGPCDKVGVTERSEARSFAFQSAGDRIVEHGAYVMHRTSNDGHEHAGVGRYQVIWIRDPSGTWKIMHMGQ